MHDLKRAVLPGLVRNRSHCSNLIYVSHLQRIQHRQRSPLRLREATECDQHGSSAKADERVFAKRPAWPQRLHLDRQNRASSQGHRTLLIPGLYRRAIRAGRPLDQQLPRRPSAATRANSIWRVASHWCEDVLAPVGGSKVGPERLSLRFHRSSSNRHSSGDSRNGQTASTLTLIHEVI